MGNLIKMAVAKVALNCVENGMIVGLGSGTTAEAFIRALGQKIKKDNMKIKAVASSKQSQLIASEEKIPLLPNDKVISLDLMFDGADEIDPKKNMIKGRGGALFREKILAFSASEMIVLVEEKKLVPFLGSHGIVPIEILPFAYPLTIKLLENEGYKGSIRMQQNVPYISDNGNFLFDIFPEKDQILSIADEDVLSKIPGVIETGLFFHIAGRVIVGYSEEHVEILT